MPPKKKTGHKKKKKKDENVLEEPLTVEEEKLLLLRQVQSLKRELVLEAHQTATARDTIRELSSRLSELQTDYENEKKRTYDLASDMTRQYKMLKEDLQKKITGLEQDLQAKNDELQRERAEAKSNLHERDNQILAREAEIKELRDTMEHMATEFSMMLKQTLDKMSEKIVISEWQSNAKGPIIHPLENFSLGLQNQPQT